MSQRTPVMAVIRVHISFTSLGRLIKMQDSDNLPVFVSSQDGDDIDDSVAIRLVLFLDVGISMPNDIVAHDSMSKRNEKKK